MLGGTSDNDDEIKGNESSCAGIIVTRRYLTDTVGTQFNLTFRLVYLDFFTTYQAVEQRQVDLVFTNPYIYACLEREFRVSAMVSLRSRRKIGHTYYELDHFYGAFIVRANSSITKIAGAYFVHVRSPSFIYASIYDHVVGPSLQGSCRRAKLAGLLSLSERSILPGGQPLKRS